MNTTTTVMLCAMLTFALAGCTSNDGVTQDDVDDAVAAANRQAESMANEARDEGFQAGYAAAETVYNPPKHVNANRTSKATLDIDPGTHRAFTVNSTTAGNLTYEVVLYAGPRLDVLVMRAEDYSASYDPEDAYEPCTDWDATSAKRACRLPAGEWIVVLDNEAGGGAEPGGSDDEVVRLRFTFEAAQPVRSQQSTPATHATMGGMEAFP